MLAALVIGQLGLIGMISLKQRFEISGPLVAVSLLLHLKGLAIRAECVICVVCVICMMRAHLVSCALCLAFVCVVWWWWCVKPFYILLLILLRTCDIRTRTPYGYK